MQVPSAQLVDVEARGTQGGGVGEGHGPVDAQPADAVPGGVQQRLVVAADPVELLPGVLHLRDVLHGADQPDHPPAGVALAAKADLGHPLDAVRADHPVPVPQRASVLEDGEDQPLQLCAVGGMHTSVEALETRPEGLRIHPHHAVQLGRPRAGVLDHVIFKAAQAGDLLCFGQLRLALAQPFLDEGPQRDVAGEPGHADDGPPLVSDRRHGDRHVDAPAILRDPLCLDLADRFTGAGPPEQGRRRFLQLEWHQHLQRCPDRLLRRISVQALRRRIPVDDDTLERQSDGRIRRGVQEPRAAPQRRELLVRVAAAV